MSEKVCRWGILGAAVIARKNWQAIKNAGNAKLVAVASRDRQRAQQFIQECQSHVPLPNVPEACGSYEELLARKDIDAVYIPLPTGIRAAWVEKAAQAGKHVLCEKPCGANVGEVEKMIAVCRENRVQFMDGVMFMHSQRLEKLRATLDDGESVGPIKRIVSQFTFRAPDEFHSANIRASSELEPYGCLGDLGWYTTRIILWAMKYQMPERVAGRMLAQRGRPDSPAPVPVEFSGELFFRDGVSAGFYCSFLTENQQWTHISGEKGYVVIPDFVLPFFGSQAAFEATKPVFETVGCDFNMRAETRHIAVNEYSNNYANSQETNLFRRFSQLALSGKTDSHWPDIALQTQKVLDACLASARNGGQLLAM